MSASQTFKVTVVRARPDRTEIVEVPARAGDSVRDAVQAAAAKLNEDIGQLLRPAVGIWGRVVDPDTRLGPAIEWKSIATSRAIRASGAASWPERVRRWAHRAWPAGTEAVAPSPVPSPPSVQRC